MRNAPLVAATALLVVAGWAGGCASSPEGPRTVDRPVGVERYVEGVLAIRAGQREVAIDKLEAAVAENPELRMAHSVLGDLYREDGEYREAVPHYEAVLDLDPLTLLNYYNLGVTYQMLARLDDAQQVYAEGLAIDADDVRLNLAMGQSFLQRGEVDEALRFLERATRADPESAAAWSSVGVAHDLQGNYVFAEASYRKALELDGDSAGVRQNLAANLLSQGRAEDARALLEDVIADRDTALARKLLGDALRQDGQFAAAEAAYEAALQREDGFVPALNGLGLALIGQYEDSLQLDEPLRERAVALWERSVQRKPGQAAVAALIDKWGDDSPLR